MIQRGGGGFINYGRRPWFAITTIYETTTHTDSYCQVALHKISSIKLFYKSLDGATISVVFDKFIYDLREYEYAGGTPESPDERMCLTLLNLLINPVSDLRWHIKIYERVKNKYIGFILQQVVDGVLEYDKVPITIQSYANAQSYAKATGPPPDQKYTRHDQRRDAASAATSTATE